MRDGINLAQRGLKVVVFVHQNFERVARAQTQISGLPDLRIYAYPQYEPGHISAKVEAEKATKAVQELPGILLD